MAVSGGKALRSESRPDDAVLVHRAVSGDREAFEALLERHYDRIFRIVSHIVENRQDAEDVTQDVCIGLSGKLSSWRGNSRFTTWLYRVAVNAALDAMRRNTNRERIEASAAESLQGFQPADGMLSSASLLLRRSLNELTEKQRVTLILVLAEGLTHAEAAKVLGVSENTVAWRVHSTRKRLRRLLEADLSARHERRVRTA